jgi:hypothetical protein
MHFNPDNPIACALRDKHITPEYIAKIAFNTGYENVNDFLSYFEPKQEYREEHSGTGNGTTASEVQHYINVMPENTIRMIAL